MVVLLRLTLNGGRVEGGAQQVAHHHRCEHRRVSQVLGGHVTTNS